MTAIVPEPVRVEDSPSFSKRVYQGYLEAALFTLDELEKVTREVDILDKRGSIAGHRRQVKRQTELRESADRYKTLAQLLQDGELF